GSTLEDPINLTAGTYTVTITDMNGCTGTYSIMVNTYLGMEDETATGNVSIYPNPSNGNFNISVTGFEGGDISFEIIDMSGRVLYLQKTAQASGDVVMPFQLGNLPSGTYFVRLSTATRSSAHTIIISK